MAHSFERGAAGPSGPASLQLKDAGLFREECLIDGRWQAADEGGTLPVRNPAPSEQLGTIPKMGAGETRRVTEWLAEHRPDVAIEVHHGGQPLYPFLISIE